MTIRLYFEWGCNHNVPGRISYPSLMDTSIRPQNLPFQFEISCEGWGPIAKWHQPDRLLQALLFADAFDKVAFQALQAKEALGINHANRVRVGTSDGEIIEFAMRQADGGPVLDYGPRWSDTYIYVRDGERLTKLAWHNKVGQRGLAPKYEHIFREAVATLLRHEVEMKKAHGLSETARFKDLLPRLVSTGKLYRAAKLSLTASEPMDGFEFDVPKEEYSGGAG